MMMTIANKVGPMSPWAPVKLTHGHMHIFYLLNPIWLLKALVRPSGKSERICMCM